MVEPRHAQINIARIPISGSVGAGVAIAVLLGAMAIELPGVRGTVLWGGLAGLVLAAALIAWRRPRSS
jgi:hypothetical protein